LASDQEAPPTRSLERISAVLERLRWMREQRIWPNGLRYLWTDAFGVVLLLSLRNALGEDRYLEQAEWVIREVDRVLGRRLGLRIGEEPDRDGQYFHYLAMWIFALQRMGRVDPRHRERAIELVRQVHPRFVIPGVGVVWKMLEDLSGPYPGYGLGALDPFHGYVVYRLLDPDGLRKEIEEMGTLVRRAYPSLHVDQDLGLGMLLWMSHFFREEPWARALSDRALAALERLWIDPPGYFCRAAGMPGVAFAFTNYGISVGLQAVGAPLDRVAKLERFFSGYRSGDEYDTNAITHVMACASMFPGELLTGTDSDDRIPQDQETT
jgi:hypothetical protein